MQSCWRDSSESMSECERRGPNLLMNLPAASGPTGYRLTLLSSVNAAVVPDVSLSRRPTPWNLSTDSAPRHPLSNQRVSQLSPTG